MTPSEFAETNWLSHLWEPLPSAECVQANSVEVACSAAYTEYFEVQCVADHADASAASDEALDASVRVASAAFMAAYQLTENADFAGLVSDDARTIYCLLSLGRQLKPFTQGRIEWLRRGHFACGYEGTFPFGKWIVA